MTTKAPAEEVEFAPLITPKVINFKSQAVAHRCEIKDCIQITTSKCDRCGYFICNEHLFARETFSKQNINVVITNEFFDGKREICVACAEESDYWTQCMSIICALACFVGIIALLSIHYF